MNEQIALVYFLLGIFAGAIATFAIVSTVDMSIEMKKISSTIQYFHPCQKDKLEQLTIDKNRWLCLDGNWIRK